MSTAELERLVEQGALFHLLVDSVRDYAIFALDPEGRIASWNTGATNIKGYTADEVVGRHFAMFYTPEDRARGVPGRLLAAAVQRGSVSAEGWRLRKDGSRFWASVVITTLRSREGRLLGFAKVTRDLTERREADQALRRRERQLSDAQQLAGLGGWEWDVRADRIMWTEAMCRIHGIDRSQVPNTFEEFLARVHPDDRAQLRSAVQRSLRLGTGFEFEERIVRADGEVRVLQSRGRVILDADGAVERLVGASLDVTDRRQAQSRTLDLAREHAAREAAESAALRMGLLVRGTEVLAASQGLEDTLHNITEVAVPEIVDWCALDLLEDDGTLRRASVAHPDPEKRALAMTYLERFPPGRRKHGFQDVIETGAPKHYRDLSPDVLAGVVDDPEEREVLAALEVRSAVTVPLAGRNGVLGVLTLVQGASGRRLGEHDIWLARELGRHAALAIENARLREELQQRTAEAEEASRAKSAFFAATSHELRTPLNAIVGHVDLLELGVHGPVNGAQLKALDRIKRNQRVLLALINDVLNYAKLEAGRLEFVLEDVPAAELLDEMCPLVQPQVDARGLTLTVREVPEDLRVRADRDRAQQVLLNLLTNAVKFTEPGGTVEMSAVANGERVRLEVRDTGHGIAPEELDAIFDPFVQVGRRTKIRTERGVGLGLAISRDLAEAMGGTLTVTSAVGEGSTFVLALPRA